jgi:hypothetical protein
MKLPHIDNLYQNQTVLLFKECYALEKIHGCSATISWENGVLKLHAGGEKQSRFEALFDQAKLTEAFITLGHPEVIVYGEAYGGSQQGMSHTYGNQLKFVAFEVKVGDYWLSVPNAEEVAGKLGVEFVHYVRVSTDLEVLNAERDKPSVQAIRNGVTTVVGPEVIEEGIVEHPVLGRLRNPRKREGVVLRPIQEFTKSNGERVISKHKGDDFKETATSRKVVDPSQQVVFDQAEAIAREWCVPMRLEHVLQKMEIQGMQDVPRVIKAMVEDIKKESEGEIVWSKEAEKAIARVTAQLFKKRLQDGIPQG